MMFCIDSLFILNTFSIITGTIFIVCFCKPKQQNKCPVRTLTPSMRAAPVSDVMIDSTRTAMDKEEKKKNKSREASRKSSRKSRKKKKKSADASMKISKKSKKGKKSEKGKNPEKIVKKLEVRGMDDDVKSTQRSAKSDPKAAPQLRSALSKTPKSGPIAPTIIPSTGVLSKPVSPAKSLAPTPAVAQTPVPDTAPAPRSAPLPNSAESKGIKSMPAF